MSDERRATVLIVDDEPANIEILAEALDEQCELVFATSGEEALELAASLRPEVILLDVVMPGMDGYAVLARLKDQPHTAEIPVIFVTSLGDVVAEARGLELGAMDYISKPISPPVVQVRVRNQVALHRAQATLRRLAFTDGLTGLYNRRHFDHALDIECRRLSRGGSLLSLIMFDVDHFKLFNDGYGHLAGDDCLRSVGGVIPTVLGRPTDIGARYGGEEFACILPETEHDGAKAVAERIRAGIAALAIPHERSSAAPYVTASLGLVTLRCRQDTTPADVIQRADEQLYAAKHNGRNQVCAVDL
ncbi:MAG TPA: diguanylate cyclase [Stellaceae bacterium]|nr:diguanylate cyclase [Stellaceae bacterium]